MSQKRKVESTPDSTSGNFWERKNHSVVSRTTREGYALCNQYRDMFQELESLLTSFSSGLGGWCDTWCRKIEKSQECGSSLSSALLALIDVARAMGASQSSVAADLKINVVAEMTKWKKANYRKNLVGKIKEAEEIEAGFVASQEPWNKLLKKVEFAKQRYVDVCGKVSDVKSREEKTRHVARKPEREELRRKLAKLEKEQEEATVHYRGCLKALEHHEKQYRAEMQNHFERAEKIESLRLFHHQSLVQTSKVAFMKLVSGDTLKSLIDSLAALDESVTSVRVDDDLHLFRRRHGTDMPLNLPKFEEITQNSHRMARGPKLSEIRNQNLKESKSCLNFNGLVEAEDSFPTTTVPRIDANKGIIEVVEKQTASAKDCVVKSSTEFDREPGIQPRMYLNRRVGETAAVIEAPLGERHASELGRVTTVIPHDRPMIEGLTEGEETWTASSERPKKRPTLSTTPMEIDATERLIGIMEKSVAPTVVLAPPTPLKTPDDDDHGVFSVSTLDPNYSRGSIWSDVSTRSRSSRLPSQYLKRQSRIVSSGDSSYSAIEEPEMTLAGGGSALGGDFSSFAQDLTMPGNRTKQRTPNQMSTGVKSIPNSRFKVSRVVTPDLSRRPRRPIFSFSGDSPSTPYFKFPDGILVS